MAAKPLKIGELDFRIQGDAFKYFSSMLARYDVAEYIPESDAVHLRALLERHRCKDEIVGAGIDSFTTTISPQGSKCFAVLRADGTPAGFSYKKCISQIWGN